MKRSASKDFEVKASSIDCLMSLSSRSLGTYHLISLANACELVGVDHRALSDTLASIRLYKAITAE